MTLGHPKPLVRPKEPKKLQRDVGMMVTLSDAESEAIVLSWLRMSWSDRPDYRLDSIEQRLRALESHHDPLS